MGIQDAAMLPAQTAGNLFIQRLATEAAAFVPTTQTFDSTTSSTTLNSTAASSGGGSLRNLMMPINNESFVPVAQNQSPAFYNGPQYSQFGDQQLTAAIQAASGIDYSGRCGRVCVREMGETVVIDEDNTNGIDDNIPVPMPKPQPPVYSLAFGSSGCGGVGAAQPASIQYVTYNA